MVGAKEPELVAAGDLEDASERVRIRSTPALCAARPDSGNSVLDAMVQEIVGG
jgi:hypothetical protein